MRGLLAGRILALLLSCSSLFAATERLDLKPSPGERKVGFTLLSATTTGVLFSNTVPEQRHLTNQILLNGSGVAAGDVDGDGLCDLFFAALGGGSTLYHNLGNWGFEDATAKAGLRLTNLTATGCALADLNGDGALDLVLNTLGQGTHIYYNNGRGAFRESDRVLNEGRGGMSLALGDIDGDGFLDLYIANYRTLGLMDIPNARGTFKKVAGKTVLDTFNGRSATEPDLRDRFTIGPRGNVVELGEADVLYRNLGGTNFAAVPFTQGAFLDEQGQPLKAPPFDWGLSAMMRDANGDGLPDIYVCNDFQTEDRFWLNQGGGKFRLISMSAMRKSSLFSMAVDFADINRDGKDDFLVLDMLSREHSQRMRDLTDSNPPAHIPGAFLNRPQYGMNTLFLNRADGSYAEIAQLSGLHAAEWAWSCAFIDVDLDGWEDLLVCNGMERASRNLDVADEMKAMRAANKKLTDAEIFQARREFPRLATANLAFRNRKDLTFEEVGGAWGFDLPGVSHGMVLADLDNDGDLDVILNNFNAPAALYRNESIAPRVAVRLKGLAPNTQGVGARVTVKASGLPDQSQEIISGGRYLSSDAPMRAFAAGQSKEVTVEVRWRNGGTTVLQHVPANSSCVLDESESAPPPMIAPTKTMPLFEDLSAKLSHVHHDDPFDDFARQPLLPNKLSYAGPGVLWADLDSDGWEDLIIGAGSGGRMGGFRNDGKGGFVPFLGAIWERTFTRDQLGLAAIRTTLTNSTLLAVLSNYEDGLSIGAGMVQFSAQQLTEPLQARDSSFGAIACADVDGDGALDVFVGGRVVPAKYPLPATSLLLRGQAGGFVPDGTNAELFKEIGLVTGALFTDWDGDGDPDLVLACEWGSIRLFENERGKFRDRTEASGLSKYVGWWNGIAAADFDGDGRMDLAASNWGRNTPYEEYRPLPLLAYAGDLDGDGILDFIEAHHDKLLRKIVPDRPLTVLGKSLAFLREKFPTHQAYSVAGIEEILGDPLRSARTLQTTTLESMVFLNRTNGFEAIPLPIEAQMSPAFGICAADFDGDGKVDLALAQNFYAVQPLTPRYDAGKGLLLKGQGNGHFTAVSPQESGIHLDGEQRGVACADYDQDGRMDLVIAQNSAETHLLHNHTARPGLRVTLVGRAGNLSAVGASVRLRIGNRLSPRQEVRAGSGYYSQDGATLIFERPTVPAVLEVRWPGGKRSEAQVSPGLAQVTVRQD